MGVDPVANRPRRVLAASTAYLISAVVLIAPTVFLALPWTIDAWRRLVG